MKSQILSLVIVTVLSVSSQAQMFKKTLDCEYVDQIQSYYLANHLVYKQKDNELQKRVVEQYIKHQDGAKIYFLQSDVTSIQNMMKTVFDQVAKKDCKFATEIQTLIVQRVSDRVASVKKILDKSFKFNKETEFTYDPDHKEFPKNIKEADEFLSKYVQFQVANYLATDMKIEEAKSRVIKNYERSLKRIKEVKNEEIIASYLNAFALSLDPHSAFLGKDPYEDFKQDMSLTLEGIGASLSQEDGFTTIENLISGGAAERSGLLSPQDKIVAVSKKDGKMENVIDMDLKDVVKLIKGPKGTKVKLSILRKEAGTNKKIDVEIVREKINLVDSAVSIFYQDKTVNGEKKKIGIISFPSFYADNKSGGRSSAADMKKIVADAKEKKVDGLVIDLSTNGGGSLDDAVKIGGLFIKTGNIVKSTSRSGEESPLADVDSKVDWEGPLVILTSRVSASASEILSGAMKDYNRAVIVGADHTYGKGSIQNVPQLPFDLGAMKVTIGMFYTPGGFSTQHRGVESDIVFPSPFHLDDIGEKSMDYSLPPKKLSAFVSKEGFVENGIGQWDMVKADWIKSLKIRADERMSKNTEFKKITEDLEKTKKTGKLIKVSEVLKDKGEKEKKVKSKRYADKKEKDQEYLKRPEIQEAANILSDLIVLEAGKIKDLSKVTIQ